MEHGRGAAAVTRVRREALVRPLPQDPALEVEARPARAEVREDVLAVGARRRRRERVLRILRFLRRDEERRVPELLPAREVVAQDGAHQPGLRLPEVDRGEQDRRHRHERRAAGEPAGRTRARASPARGDVGAEVPRRAREPGRDHDPAVRGPEALAELVVRDLEPPVRRGGGERQHAEQPQMRARREPADRGDEPDQADAAGEEPGLAEHARRPQALRIEQGEQRGADEGERRERDHEAVEPLEPGAPRARVRKAQERPCPEREHEQRQERHSDGDQGLRARALRAGVGRGEEDPIPADDRRGEAVSAQLHLPGEMRRIRAELRRQIGLGRHGQPVGAAPLRPVLGRERAAREGRQEHRGEAAQGRTYRHGVGRGRPRAPDGAERCAAGEEIPHDTRPATGGTLQRAGVPAGAGGGASKSRARAAASLSRCSIEPSVR